MLKVCAWCEKDLGAVNVEGASDDLVTHGICSECANRFEMAPKSSVAEFLENLDDPVFLVGAGGRIVSANAAAKAVVGAELTPIWERLAGEVFGCVNANLPGGCGRTVECKACVIRNSVNETLATGIGVERAPALQHVKTAGGVVRRQYRVSTERVGGSVLLRIDDVA